MPRPKLTDQQLVNRAARIAQIFADGGYIDEVAKELGFTYWTARKYVAETYQLTGAETRTHLVAWAFRQGLIK